MALSLANVLEHPGMKQSGPRVVAGDPTQRTVRWVHSSDIYDIAPLLRGGELLLTTGLGLATATAEERRSYVRGLADREIAGLALELADTFSEVPEEMVSEAQLRGLPFIVLTHVYPFVEVTEQINSAILDSSIVRLRHADDVGRALSRVLAERGGLDSLTATLARIVERPVVITGATGAVLAAAGDDVSEVLRAPAATATITADGILLGGLAIGEGSTDDDLLRAATDRAPEIFALEVLRGRQQPLLAGRERRDLLGRLISGAAGGCETLLAHALASRIRPDSHWAGLAISPSHGTLGLSLAQDLAREAGVHVLAAELNGTVYALLALPVAQAQEVAGRIHSALRRASGPIAAVGPAVPSSSAGRSLRAARQTLQLAEVSFATQRLMLADELVVERLLAAVSDPVLLADLVDEQLGGLLCQPNSEMLISTLEHYLASGCCKASTARVLHLRRQSVHHRLARIAGHLGQDISDPRRQMALGLALVAHRTARGGPSLFTQPQDTASVS